MDEGEALQAHYGLGKERDRLSTARGRLEFERSKEILARHLPPPGTGVVADIGGGSGRYALWLAERGHAVEHRDPVPLHVAQVREGADAAGVGGAVRTAAADARDLDLGDACADAVLLLGPLYHLRRRADRVCALREAARVVRPGGAVFAAAISRWAPRHDDLIALLRYRDDPSITARIVETERSGWMPPPFPGAFWAYLHRPGELRDEVAEAGLDVVDLVGVEGLGHVLPDLDARMDDPLDRAALLDAARATERVPELLGVSPHLIATGVCPR
ncbi:class I SAM-dependent methyltransferase [Actinomadura fibrosa]|uniref:Class I SAM-dependent methyltransferase n=1 Tax=Actinomadura fibrosa TaxID=111802 RepID=A0ABW2XF40_9ACTN|nr:class I SAM-dependent methyltransferase [Actinomadura fibrosa]